MRNIIFLIIIANMNFCMGMEVPESFYNLRYHYGIEWKRGSLTQEKLNMFFSEGLSANAIIDEDNNSILHTLVIPTDDAYKYLQMVLLTLKKGANFNMQNKFGKTPLHILAAQDSSYYKLIMAFALLASGSSTMIPDIDNHTPLSLVVHNPAQSSYCKKLFLAESSPTDVFQFKLNTINDSCVVNLFREYSNLYNQRIPRSNERIIQFNHGELVDLELCIGKYKITPPVWLKNILEERRKALVPTIQQSNGKQKKCCIIQ